MREAVQIVGAGPSGAAAALSALQQGASVLLYDKSRFPRHKVCGEFLSSEIAPLLHQLGLWNDFQAASPARISRLHLHFRSTEKLSRLPETAYGFSRYRFDQFLLDHAIRRGARFSLQAGPEPHPENPVPTILAWGRKTPAVRGQRLFGFKAHFDGPCDDAIELFFFDGCYVGVNSIEEGKTNVCGLGPEDFLASRNFEFDEIVNNSPQLSERLRPLRRNMKWLSTGPLVFQNIFKRRWLPAIYPAGDALCFVDPFTGSGLLSAVLSGKLAGEAAAHALPVPDYLAQCRRHMGAPFQFSSLLRKLLALGWTDHLAGMLPTRVLVSLTRPHGSL